MDLLSPAFRERLQRLWLAAERVSGGRRTGFRRSRIKGVGQEFVSHRAYVPGDDPRYLDWNVHARLDQLVVKEFETPGEVTQVLALDCSRSMHYGSPNKFNHARQLAAALGYITLRGHDRAVIVPLDDGALPPRTAAGAAGEMELLDGLSKLRPARAATGASGWLARLRDLRGEMQVVLLTDFLNRAPLLEALSWLARMKAQVLLVHVIAPQEYHPRFSGRVRFEDVSPTGESGGCAKLEVTPETLASYHREFDQYRHAVASACSNAGAYHFEVGTHESMEDLTLELVAVGMLRIRKS